MATHGDNRFGSAARQLSGLAARIFGWPPNVFWQATPAELSAVLACEEAAAPRMNRQELMELMERIPDG